MPYNVENSRPDQVIIVTLSDPLTIEDLRGSMHDLFDIYENATQPVVSISDVTRVTRLPNNVLSSLRLNREVAPNHPMRGLSVLVIDNVYVSAMASIFTKLLPASKFRITQTMEQAWKIIEKEAGPKQSAATE
jgi:hypothetical protein